MKSLFLKSAALCSALVASFQTFALDVTGVTTAVTAAQTDVETVAVAIIAVAAVMFGIAKIRQVIKA